MCVRCINSTTAASMPFGCDIQLLPQSLPLLRRHLQRGVRLIRPGELRHEEIGQLAGDCQIVPLLGLDVERSGDFVQPARIGDLVSAALPPCDQLQRLHQHAAVVGVRGGARGDLAQQVARGDRIGIGAADALAGFRGDAARAHVAEPAADAGHAEFALRLLALIAIPYRSDAFIPRDLDHTVNGRIARNSRHSGLLFRI